MNTESPFELGLNYGQLLGGALLWILGALVVSILSAGLLHWAGHQLGLFSLKRVEEPRKVLWSVAVMGMLFSSIIGGWTGCKVGVVRAGVSAVTTAGPRLLRAGIEEGLKSAGLTNSTGIEIKKLREFLDQAEDAELEGFGGTGAEHWGPYIEKYRPQIEEFRKKAIAEARGILDRHAKGDTFTVDDLVNALLPMFTSELTRWTRGFTRWEVITGFIWIAGIEGFLALMCGIVRFFSAKPKPNPPPSTPPAKPPGLPPKIPPPLPAV